MGLKEDVSLSDSEASDLEDAFPSNQIIKKSKVIEKLEKVVDKQEKIEVERQEKFERKSNSLKKYRGMKKTQNCNRILFKPNKYSPIINLYPIIRIIFFINSIKYMT